jgi:hypothetical protein
MTHVKLDELVEFAFNRACKELIGQKGEMEWFFVIVTPTGECEVLEGPPGARFHQLCTLIDRPEHMCKNGAVAWASAFTLPGDESERPEQLVIMVRDSYNLIWSIGRSAEIARGPW